MNPKLQTKLTAIAGAVFGFIAWLSTVPPEQQSGVLGVLTAVFPVSWQSTIGLFSKAMFTFLSFWSVYKASHAGADSPPVDPPTTTSTPKSPSFTSSGC